MIPLIPIITRAGAMLLMKQMAKRAARKKILKDAALKKKVDKIGKKAAKKEAKKKENKKKHTKKQLQDADQKRKDAAARKAQNIRIEKQKEEGVVNPHYEGWLYSKRQRHRNN